MAEALAKSSLDVIDRVRSESSTLKKIAILKEHQHNPVLHKIFRMTFDPEYVYGIKKVPNLDEIPAPSHSHQVQLSTALDKLKKALVIDKMRGKIAYAKIIEILSDVDIVYRELALDVIQRNLKINIGSKGINKAIRGLLMDKHYMGAQPYSEIRAINITNSTFFSQEKMDGMYANLMLKDLSFISRNIKNIYLNIPELRERMEHIKEDFIRHAATSNIVLNGELLIHDMDRYTSNGVLNSISKIEAKINEGEDPASLKELDKLIDAYGDYNDLKARIHYVVWDFIPERDFKRGGWNAPYNRRFNELSKVILSGNLNIPEDKKPFVTLVPTEIYQSLAQAQAHFKEIRSAGGEGTIIKTFSGTWKSGKPAWQIKLKYELEVELVITGFRPGDPGTKYEKTLGAYIVRSDDFEIQTKAPGLSELEREYGWTHQEERLGQIISVKCNGMSQDKNGKYSLLHPRFNGMRLDKDVADTLEEIIIADGGIIKEVDFAGLGDKEPLGDII